MKRHTVALAMVVALVAVALGADTHEHVAAAPVNKEFEKLKSLVGTWVEADENGKPTENVVSIIKLTAGGSAIHETIFPGQEHEMMSVYTVEGNDVVMTHFCVLGNQPRLKANPKASDNELRFEFAGGANLDPKKDRHMHSATLIIHDADHIEINGTGWENGAPADQMCGVMKLVRKK